MATVADFLRNFKTKTENVENVYPSPKHTSLEEEGEDLYGVEGDTHAQKRYFPDTYLDSPILITPRLKWVAAIAAGSADGGGKQFQRTFDAVMAVIPAIHKYQILDPDEYPGTFHHPWPATLTDEHDQAWEVAQDIRSSVSRALESQAGVPLDKVPAEISHEAKYWYDRWSYFDSMVEEYSRKSTESAPPIQVIKLGGHTELVATREIWFLKYAPDDLHYLLTYDQVLMIKDVLYSRAQVQTAIDVFYPDSDELRTAVKELYEWHEQCLTRHGNKGYEILKSTESLAKTYLSQMTDKVFGDLGPYGRMLVKIRTKEEGWKTLEQEYMADKFDRVLRKCTSVQTVVELFGLLKVSGHPLIDPMVGGLSSAEEAQTADNTLFLDAERLNWEFKRCMLENYINKEGKWPELHFSDVGRKTKLKKLCSKQIHRLHRASYPLEDWRHCRFGKIVDFDYSPNYLDLIDDKSISQYRTNIAAFWDPSIPKMSHRRLLIELINREKVDIKAIVHAIMRREIPFDWLIVSLHPKEREFKLAPRMFSMLVFEIRIFFALTEANLADRIFPYIPHQTMTNSRQATSQQFLDMTKPRSDAESLRMFIEIDLTRWNLRWRQLAIGMIGRTLNDMFDMPGVFDYCHEFFSSAMIVVRVPGLKPDGIEQQFPPAGPLIWYKHMGGFEGICQKLWSVATFMMIALAMADQPVSYTLLGQGDNQVLSIMKSRVIGEDASTTLIRYRDTITTKIEEACANVNQEAKPEEFVDSTTVISYSKDVYVEGVYRPTTLKFHSRLFPHSSQVFPSVRTNLGAVFSTAMAGAEKSVDPMRSHFLACFHAGMYLNRVSKGRGPFGAQMALVRKKLSSRWSEYLNYLLILPSECGGYPTIPPVGFMYKGGSDPLGKSVSSMVWLGLNAESRLYNRMLAQLSDDRIYNPRPKISSLFMDPFSAPFMKPPTAVDGIASDTVTALTAHVKTIDIAQLLSTDIRSYIDNLVELFAQVRPMNPLIVRDILDCSIAGITDTISRMFVATRTLQELVRSVGIPIVDMVLHLEAGGILDLFHRFEKLPTSPAKSTTAFDLTTSMRNRWTPGQVSPIVGITTYQPMDFPVLWDVKPLEVEGVNAILVADTDPFETRGPYQPYVGSKTREKRSEHGYKIVGTDGASMSMRKLQLIASQIGTDPGMKKILDAVAWSRTDTQLSEISHLLPGASGGTLSHRYAARAGHQGAFNVGSPNFFTHCVISTDNTGKLAGGMLDYPIMFQEFILYCLWLVQWKAKYTGKKFISITIRTDQLEIEPLPSVELVSPPKFSIPVVRFPENALTYLENLRLERVAGTISHLSLPIDDNFAHSPNLIRMTLEAYFRDKLRNRSAGRVIADGGLTLFQAGTLDIAEVKACGIGTICKAIANVVVDEAVRDFVMTDSISRTRWRPEVYAQKLISPLALTISPHLGHHLLKDDPILQQYLMYDYPTYAGGYSQSHERLCGSIAERVRRTLSGGNQSYNHRPAAVFTSSTNHSSSETLLTLMLTDLYIWKVRGDLTRHEVRQIVSMQVIPYLRHTRDETDRVALLYRVCGNLRQIWTKQNKLALANVMNDYIVGVRLRGMKIAIPDMLKSFRTLVTAPVARPAPLPLTFPARGPQPRIFTAYELGKSREGIRALEDTAYSRQHILREIFHRNLGRYMYAVGSSLYYWIPYSSLLPSKHPLIVVGSGHGAVARVALERGIPKVFGIDLRSSIPMKAHRFVSYKPPLVNSSEYHARYEQIPESFTTSGDWFDRSVVMKVMAYDPGKATIVIDIEAGSKRYGLELLQHVVSLKTYGRILIRMFLTTDETHALACDLKLSGCEFYEFDDGRDLISSRLFVLTRWSPVLRMSTTSFCTSTASPTHLATPASQQYSFQHRAIAISDALLNTVCVSHNTSLQDIERDLDISLEQSVGNYESRYSYHEWTRFLRAKLAVKFIQMPASEALEFLSTLYTTGHTMITVANQPVRLEVPWDMCRHLASVCARVLGT